MKIQQETVYRCDHCNRSMLGKGAMSRHEKYCRQNPNNKHKCFEFCKHLEKAFTHEETGDYNNEPRITHMTCTKLNIKMYSYKFEKNTTKPINALIGLTRMPLECDSYEDMHEPTEDYDFDEFKI